MIEKLKALLAQLQTERTDERTERNRYLAILITETEKLIALCNAWL